MVIRSPRRHVSLHVRHGGATGTANSPPPWGRGRGWGSMVLGEIYQRSRAGAVTRRARALPPPPHPLPQGGGSRPCLLQMPISNRRNLQERSFDHLVGNGEQRRRHLDAERARGLQVDDELEL